MTSQKINLGDTYCAGCANNKNSKEGTEINTKKAQQWKVTNVKK